jgi:predicted glutamine amidotransferase
MAGREIRLRLEKSWRWLWTKLRQLNRLGTLNCLLSDGQVLCCYYDVAGHKGLHWRPMNVGRQEVRHLEDRELQIELEGQSANHGIVVATEPLSGSGWCRFQPGELMVFERGELRFSSRELKESGCRD